MMQCAQSPAFASAMYVMPERHICCCLCALLFRCLATFGLTRLSIMDDDTDISGDKWDVYSLAVIMSFLFSEQRPYSGLNDAEIMHGVVEDGLRPETAGMEPRLAALVSRMWSAKPTDRPSAADVSRALADGVV